MRAEFESAFGYPLVLLRIHGFHRLNQLFAQGRLPISPPHHIVCVIGQKPTWVSQVFLLIATSFYTTQLFKRTVLKNSPP